MADYPRLYFESKNIFSDNPTLSESFSIYRAPRINTISPNDSITITEDFSTFVPPQHWTVTVDDSITISEDFSTFVPPQHWTVTVDEGITITDDLVISRDPLTFEVDVYETMAIRESMNFDYITHFHILNIDEEIALEEEFITYVPPQMWSFSVDDTITITDTDFSTTATPDYVGMEDDVGITENLTIGRNRRANTLILSDAVYFNETFDTIRPVQRFTLSFNETIKLKDPLTPKLIERGVIITRLEIGGVEYDDAIDINITKQSGDTNGTASFSISMLNTYGKHSDDFEINDEVKVYASETPFEPELLFTGIIEDIKFSGKGTQQKLSISGRDYGALLQDIIVEPRIFKDDEISEIVEALLIQNLPHTITTTNINVTGTTVDKITFNNVSIFDAIKELAEIAGFYFYVDENKDLHFTEKDSIASDVLFDSASVVSSNFTTSDMGLYNDVTVYGDRQLTGAREIFTTGTDNTGSVYVLDAKPFNVGVVLSGATNTQLQPGGIMNVNDPETENTKFLVNHHSQSVTLTSGTAAGNNVQATGSVVIIDYQRSTPIIKRVTDSTSVSEYGKKSKTIIDRNIKDFDEAIIKATTTLSESKDPKVNGTLNLLGVFNINPGEVATINIPSQGKDLVQYSMIEVDYNFNPINNLTKKILKVKLNKKIYNFVDTMKEQILRMRLLEASDTETSITTLQTSTDLVGVSGTAVLVSKSIGSAFYFGIPNHNVFNSPSSVLGPWEGGSSVITI